jgi:hypothetical protein
MRIQETDRVLKDAKFARHSAVDENRGSGMSRAWIAGIVAFVAVLVGVAFFAKR